MVREQPRRTSESSEESTESRMAASAARRGAQENPYSWMHPVLRARWKRHQELYRILDVRRVDLDEFERELLIPQLHDRVVYMREMFERIRDIAAAPETAYRIAAQFRKLAPDDAPGADGDSTTSYLKEVTRQADEIFIASLKRIELEHQSVSSLRELYRFFNELRYICDVARDTENLLFRYKSKLTIVAIDKVSGERIEQDKEWNVILMPFELTLGELRRVAAATADSIDHWSKKQDEAKKPFLEYVAAATNATTSRRTIFIQLAAIALSLSFSAFFLTARDPFSLKRENAALKQELQVAKDEVVRLAGQVQQLQEQLRSAPMPPDP